MCLNCLPTFEKCFFCIGLRFAVIIISALLLVVPAIFIGLELGYSKVLGIHVGEKVNVEVWFLVFLFIWIIESVLLILVWTGNLHNVDVSDVILQIFFWISVANMLVYLAFCIAYMMLYYKTNLLAGLMHFAAFFGMLAEVESFCYFFTLRVGMLFIGVLAVITGALTLSVTEQNAVADFDALKNVSRIRQPTQVMTNLSPLILSGISFMSVLFMVTGSVLLFATLTDQEGFIQVFVWVTFLDVLIGFIMVAAIGYQCMMYDDCTLSSMDWLSASTFLVLIVGYLFVWIYFISVANSYLVGVTS